MQNKATFLQVEAPPLKVDNVGERFGKFLFAKFGQNLIHH